MRIYRLCLHFWRFLRKTKHVRCWTCRARKSMSLGSARFYLYSTSAVTSWILLPKTTGQHFKRQRTRSRSIKWSLASPQRPARGDRHLNLVGPLLINAPSGPYHSFQICNSPVLARRGHSNLDMLLGYEFRLSGHFSATHKNP
jgi:hypothetical protein